MPPLRGIFHLAPPSGDDDDSYRYLLMPVRLSGYRRF